MCWKCDQPKYNHLIQPLSPYMYNRLMRPPPMVRMHKGYCKQCNKCMDSIISPEIW